VLALVGAGVVQLLQDNTALLIIDMQKGMRAKPLASRNNHHAEQVIAEVLSIWRAAKKPIVHIRHISRTPGSPFWPGQEGAEFQPELAPLQGEHVVEKNVPDAFINTALERWLRVRDIRKIVIAGVSTNNSVESTARTAGNLGIDTYVLADGTYAYAQTDFDGVNRSAQEVHAMALSNLHGEYATVTSLAEIKTVVQK
jgi:nicotinamidase-related amidase